MRIRPCRCSGCWATRPAAGWRAASAQLVGQGLAGRGLRPWHRQHLECQEFRSGCRQDVGGRRSGQRQTGGQTRANQGFGVSLRSRLPARVRCPDCHNEYLLPFSCRGPWFCPLCHSKKVVQFGSHLQGSGLFPVPHRQYVFSIPKNIRRQFLYDRKLLGKPVYSTLPHYHLCSVLPAQWIARECARGNYRDVEMP